MINPKLAMWSQLERAGIPLDPTENPYFDVVRKKTVKRERSTSGIYATRYCVGCQQLRGIRWFDGFGNTCRECLEGVSDE